MAQITIELDDDSLCRLKASAELAGMSESEWLNEMIRARTRDEWPKYILDLAGAWPDFPEVDEIGAYTMTEPGQQHP